MRRIQSTPQDPDVEESRAELEHLEGKKNTAQTDVLAIAENKKQLEADFEESKKRLDTQITEKKEEFQRVTNSFSKLVLITTASQKEAELARDKAIEERKHAEKDLETIRMDVASSTGKKESVDELVKSLTSIEQRLRSSIAHLAPQERTLEVRKAKLSHEVADLEKKVAELIDSYSRTHATHVSEQHAHEELKASRGTVESDLNGAKDRLAQIKEEITTSESALTDVQKKRAEHEAEMQKRESAANERMANATHLEQRINVKLEQLKDAEKEFTVEHLARIGYKPIA